MVVQEVGVVMGEVITLITRATEVVGSITSIVAFDTWEIRSPQERPTSITYHRYTDFSHIVKRNKFLKIERPILISVEKFEQVWWNMLAAIFSDEIQELNSADFPVSVCVY